MMKASTFIVLILTTACEASTPSVQSAAPAKPESSPPNVIANWRLVGSGPSHFEFVSDRDVKHGGQASARLRAVSDPGAKFGALMQNIAPGEYRGKRVQLSGFVRTQGVGGWTGLWMRVDRDNAPIESFDNMQSRAIKGTTEWAEYQVVLDVQPDAANIAFGVLQEGTGTTWIDDLHMQVVDSSVTATGPGQSQKPVNLDFEGS
jgi:hypothetical protein